MTKVWIIFSFFPVNQNGQQKMFYNVLSVYLEEDR